MPRRSRSTGQGSRGRQQPDREGVHRAGQATFTVTRKSRWRSADGPEYTGILNDHLRGLYLSQANNRRYAVTQLEATDARRDVPVVRRACVQGHVRADRDDRRGRPRDLERRRALRHARSRRRQAHASHSTTTPKMSSYLVALAVGDFVCNEGSADGTPIRICSTPDKKGSDRDRARSRRADRRTTTGITPIKYPFKKLDVVAVPDFAAGAMENTAAIFYRETRLLADPKRRRSNTRQTSPRSWRTRWRTSGSAIW